MKLIFKIVIISLVLVSCSHPKRNPASIGTPCGLKASVEERIRDCSTQESSSVGNFVLVTRTKDAHEVWKDMKSGFLWSDKLNQRMDRIKAQKACHSKLAEVGKIQDVNWKLPRIEEYQEAESNSFRSVLPNTDDKFWTAMGYSKVLKAALVFNGLTGVASVVDDKDFKENRNLAIRCIGEIKK